MVSILITFQCYDLVKRFVDLRQREDGLCKSFDERILNLLAKENRISGFRVALKYIKRYVSDLSWNSKLKHLFLRDITMDYLTVYCFVHNYRCFNGGLYQLIEKALTQITIDNLKFEIKEIDHQLSKGIKKDKSKMEEYHKISFHKQFPEDDNEKKTFIAGQLISPKQLSYLKFIADMYFRAFNLEVLNIRIQQPEMEG